MKRTYLGESWLDVSLELADRTQSKLTDREIENSFSLCGDSVRCLVNNLCAASGVVFLDIGCYRGAITFAGCYDNTNTEVISVDSFTHDPRQPRPFALDGNIWKNVQGHRDNLFSLYRGSSKINMDKIHLVTSHFQKVKYEKYTKPNLVFFDPSPVSERIYEEFFKTVVPCLLDSSMIIFTGYNNRDTASLIHKYLDNSKKFEVEYTRQKTSAGVGSYNPGLLIAGIKKIKAGKSKEQQV